MFSVAGWLGELLTYADFSKGVQANLVPAISCDAATLSGELFIAWGQHSRMD